MKFEHDLLKKLRMEPVKSCPLCSSVKRKLFTGKDKNNPIESFGCMSCGLIYMGSAVLSEDIKLLYEHYNEGRDGLEPDLEKKRSKMYILDYQYVNKYIHKNDKSVLDIGCGRGDFLSMFNKNIAKYGLEIDSAARVNGKKKYKNTSFFSSFEQINEKQMFDIIIFRGTLQYMTNLAYVANFCKKHLKKNGKIFILATPNADSLLAQIQKEYWALWNWIEHRYYFGLDQIRLLFPGLKLVDYNFPYMGTPYENYPADVKKVLKMYTDKNAIKQKVPFFGSMMNIVLEKK